MEQSTISGPVAFNRAMKPFALPLGLASPMWLAYGAAASVGATWWWMSRMTRLVAPQTTEAPVVTPPPTVAQAVLPLVEAAQPIEEAASASFDAVSELVAPVMEAPPAIEVAAAPTFEQPDELTLLRGVGPRVADALVARGVTTFAQLAGWSDHDMAKFDKELKLLGRSTRYDFLGQARELAAD